MPQFSYTRKIALPGQVAQSPRPTAIESYTNALLAQESDIDLGGFDAGTYTIQLDQTGNGLQYQITFDGTGVSTVEIVDGLEADSDANLDLVNIELATAADPTLELRFIHPGDAWAISFPSNPNANMTHDLVQAAGGTDIDVGVFVVGIPATPELCRAPAGTSVDADFIGVTVRNTESLDMDYTTLAPVFRPADTVSVMAEGVIWALTEDAVSFQGQVFARITINAPGQKLGALRSDVDGGAAVAVTGCRFYSTTASAGLAKVKINRPQ